MHKFDHQKSIADTAQEDEFGRQIQDNEEEIGPVDDEDVHEGASCELKIIDNLPAGENNGEYICGDEPEDTDSAQPGDSDEEFDDIDEDGEEDMSDGDKNKTAPSNVNLSEQSIKLKLSS
jgi:hypothetical protein